MDGAPSRKIIEVVNKCPTQALVWKHNHELTEEELKAQRHTGASEETPRSITRREDLTHIRIMKDGPIVAEGNFTVLGSDDKPLRPTTLTSFCRCGASLNMPFCDGTHRKIDFRDEKSADGE